MGEQPHILVIFGSTRQGRRGDKVVKWLTEQLSTRTDVSFETVDDGPESVSGKFLERIFNGMMDELLWWATVLTPARRRSS